MFLGFEDDEDSNDASVDDDNIRANCEYELTSYLASTGEKLKDKKTGLFKDPLLWWKLKESTYPALAKLAIAFLSIPATLAPSERVWSRAAQVLTIKRACLSEEVSSGIMFVKENIGVLRKHYAKLTANDKDALPLESSGIPMPPMRERTLMLVRICLM